MSQSQSTPPQQPDFLAKYFNWEAPLDLETFGGMRQLPFYGTSRGAEELDALLASEGASSPLSAPDFSLSREAVAQNLGAAYAVLYVQQRVLFKRKDRSPDAVAAFRSAIPADSDTASLPYAQLTLPQLVSFIQASRHMLVRDWMAARLQEVTNQVNRLNSNTDVVVGSEFSRGLRTALSRMAAWVDPAFKSLFPAEFRTDPVASMRHRARFVHGWNRVLRGYVEAHRQNEVRTKGVQYPSLSPASEAYAFLCERVLGELAEAHEASHRDLLNHARYLHGIPLAPGERLPGEDDLAVLFARGHLSPFGMTLSEARPTVGVSMSLLRDVALHPGAGAPAAQVEEDLVPDLVPDLAAPSKSLEALAEEVALAEAATSARVDQVVALDDEAPEVYGAWGSKAVQVLARHLADGRLYSAPGGNYVHLSYQPAQDAMTAAGLSVSVHGHNLFGWLEELGLISIHKIVMGQLTRLYGIWTTAGVAALQQSGIPRRDPEPKPEHLHPVFQAYKAALPLFAALVEQAWDPETADVVTHPVRYAVTPAVLAAGSQTTRKGRLQNLVQEGLIAWDPEGPHFRILDQETACAVREHFAAARTAPQVQVDEHPNLPAVEFQEAAAEVPEVIEVPEVELTRDNITLRTGQVRELVLSPSPEAELSEREFLDSEPSKDHPRYGFWWAWHVHAGTPTGLRLWAEQQAAGRLGPILAEAEAAVEAAPPAPPAELSLAELEEALGKRVRNGARGSGYREKLVQELVLGALRGLIASPDANRNKWERTFSLEQVAALVNLPLEEILRWGPHAGARHAVILRFALPSEPKRNDDDESPRSNRFRPFQFCLSLREYNIVPPPPSNF